MEKSRLRIENVDGAVIAKLHAPKFPEGVSEITAQARIEILNERQKKASGYVKEKGKLTNKEYRELNKVSKRTAVRELEDMVKKKLLTKIGKGRALHYVSK